MPPAPALPMPADIEVLAAGAGGPEAVIVKGEGADCA